MYLKSVEIQGFKSFPDYTEIKLSRGITSIVGPNGSGKSNIVDAIRWVLGEQSTKTLRGGKMEDVIFGGTKKRTPSGYSQVSITIDNSQGLLPLEYQEVTVTRRYFRSGDSDFFINKKSVRLRDVHELFMDTGLGRDGYSIIGQGRIDEILSVKSGDRREIFEEAAGITKFRYRKEEAEKKLDSTEENLIRIRDIARELEAQVGPLKEQAEKAKKYLLLRDELKACELSLWLKSIEKLSESQEKTNVDYENALRLLSAKKRELDEVFEQIEALGEQMRKKDAMADKYRLELASLVEEKAGCESKIAVLAANFKNISENIENARGQMARATAKGGQLEATAREQRGSIDALALEISALTRQVEQANADLCENEQLSQTCRRDIAAQMEILNKLQEDEGLVLRELSGKNAAFEHLNSDISSQEEQKTLLRDKIEQNILDIKAIKQEISDEREGEQEAANILAGVGLLISAKDEKAQGLRHDIEKETRRVNALHDRLSMLKALERDMEGFSRAVKAVTSAGVHGRLQGIHGTVSQLIKTPDDYGTAIEVALGGAMQNIVTDSEQTAKAAILYLKSGDIGRATFLPISAVSARDSRVSFKNDHGYVAMAYELLTYDPKYDGIIKNLLGNTAVVRDIDCAIAISRRHRGGARLVTLDGQIISQSGAMTGGNTAKGTGVLSRANEMSRITDEIALGEQGLAKIRSDHAEAVRDYESTKYRLDTAQNQLSLSKNTIIQLTTKLEGEENMCSSLVERLESWESDNLDKEQKTLALSEEIARLTENSSLLFGEISQVRDTLKKLDTNLGAYNGILLNIKGDISLMNERMSGLNSQKLGSEALYNQTLDMINELNWDRESREASITALERQLEDSVKERQNCQQLLSQLAHRISAKNSEIEAVRDEMLWDDGNRTKLQKDSQLKNETVLNMEREAARLDSRKEQDTQALKSVLDKMWESYELTPLAAAQISTPAQDINEANRLSIQLRGRLKSMGDVNLLAVDEYAKVSERYEFLATQLKDLEGAKGDILKIIDGLTSDMQETFREHFKLLNASFTQTFVEIFGGGNAYLHLEDENDILNCGIEIKVELPGKSIKTISLLSGGEKAFVAIALYFAILKVRPTPFCVLDEIEAALDDVNVVKYVSYMRKLCQNTQFIAITHRRGTMEGSDILYGVTMQEAGVSKLLTINISEMDEL